MKTLAALTLCAVLSFELSHGLHLPSSNNRLRRDAEKTADLDDRRSEVYHYYVKEMIGFAKQSINKYKIFYEKILEEAKKADINSAGLEKLRIIVDYADKLFANSVEDEKWIEQLVELLWEVVVLSDRLDEDEKSVEELKPIKKLFDENDARSLDVKFMEDFLQLRSDYEKHISAYIASLTAEEKIKERVVLDWFEEFQSATGIDKLIGTTMEGFEMLGDVELKE